MGADQARPSPHPFHPPSWARPFSPPSPPVPHKGCRGARARPPAALGADLETWCRGSVQGGGRLANSVLRIWVTSPDVGRDRRACPRAAAVEIEVRPEERRESGRWWRKVAAGEGLSGQERPPSHWAEGDTSPTKQVDLWIED